MRRSTPISLVLMAALIASSSTGCARGASPPAPDQGPATDAAIGLDLGQSDLGPTPDLSVPALRGVPADPVRFGAFSAAFSSLGLSDWSACFADPSGSALNCDAEPCSLLASCCVANGNCGGEGAGDTWPTSVTFDGCASGTGAAACLDEASIPNAPVGSSSATAATIESGALRGGGNTQEEGGVILADATDLTRERASITVRFAHPTMCDDANCLETAGVSVVADANVAVGRVQAAISLMYVGASGEVAVIVSGLRVAGWPTDDQTETFVLELTPDGQAAVYRDGEMLADRIAFAAPRRARLVLHGRNAEVTGARIDSVTIARTHSDMPAQWDPSAALPTPPPPSLRSWQPESASVTGDPTTGDLAVAIATDGAIHRGTLTMPAGAAVDDLLRIRSVESDELRSLHHPSWWVGDDGDTILLYSVAIRNSAGQLRRVLRARHGTEGPLGELPDEWDIRGDPTLDLDFPTMALVDQTLVLVARATHPESGAQGYRVYIALYTGHQPAFNELASGRQASLFATTQIPAEDSTAQELGQASLLVRDGAYRLYYARRRGARWRLSLATSDEGLVWRAFGEVYTGAESFDALGIASPTARIEGTAEALYYLGVGDLSRTLVRTQRYHAQNVIYVD